MRFHRTRISDGIVRYAPDNVTFENAMYSVTTACALGRIKGHGDSSSKSRNRENFTTALIIAGHRRTAEGAAGAERRSRRNACGVAPIKSSVDYVDAHGLSGCTEKELLMNRAMPSGIRSRIATASVMGALAAIFALSAPAHAFAAPTPLHSVADSVPTSLDGLRYAQLPLPVDHRGGSDDDDNDTYYYD
jgi:hypothetical protein